VISQDPDDDVHGRDVLEYPRCTPPTQTSECWNHLAAYDPLPSGQQNTSSQSPDHPAGNPLVTAHVEHEPHGLPERGRVHGG
jgi:hypothetical protein